MSVTIQEVPLSVKNAFQESSQYFKTPLQLFQFFDKYSRFNSEKQRRETWVETVDRSVNYLKELSKNLLSDEVYNRIKTAILEMKAAPSMRLLAMAGPAARRQNACIYNCSYAPIDSIDSFVEELIIAMSGTGVGYSVEKKYVGKFPKIKKQIGLNGHTPTHIVEDSTEGWAAAFKLGLKAWFDGRDFKFDYSEIREAGVPLKIKGGRASGPDPLKKLLDKTKEIILKRQGKKLRPIDAHDICCFIGEAIVSGGVRRTALISIFDIDDKEMRDSKNGDNLVGNEQRWMANNSAVWEREPTKEQVYSQMTEMVDGQRGEPGIFSRHNANIIKPERRKESSYGTNPCGEINLRPYEFCNLTTAIVRPEDTLETLKEKIEVATIIGTIQSSATYFPGLRDVWKKNCEEERLLGVDINGWLDTPLLRPSNKDLEQNLLELKKYAIEVNKKYSKILGINQSVSVTCVKPSGNSSQLFDCSSGMHPRHYKYYIRNVRVQAESPIKKLLESVGVPMDPENGQSAENANTWVIHFPVKAPDTAIIKDQMSAIEQCEYWKTIKLNWTEHNPSITISYKEDEVPELIKWVWENRKYVGGMSFLPVDNAKYQQMPYEKISKEEYEKYTLLFPQIDFSLLYQLEKEDYTTASGEMACASGVCSLDEMMASYTAQSLGLI